MTDFQALLSSFQSATGETPSLAAAVASTTTQAPKKPKTLKELTNDLWQRNQLKQSVKSLKKAESGGSEMVRQSGGKTRLAICLCVVDSLVHEEVWKEWIHDKTENEFVSAELYVHAKIPERITTPWAKSKLIGLTHRPNWNDVRIVKAMLSLLEEALKDTKTTHVVFGTESCLPICPLSEVDITAGKSYAAYYGKRHATRFDERDVWDALRMQIPFDAIHKALPGWCTLSREHAQQIVDMPTAHLEGKNLWEAFEECWAPEEAFFPTALALLGLLDETECKSLTYAEWNQRSARPQDKAHPKAWDDQFNTTLVSRLRNEYGCIFLRKVKYPVGLDRWKQAISCQFVKRSSHDFHDSEVSSKKPRVGTKPD